MRIFNTILGPPSKYDNNIPYAYEARYCFIDGLDEYNSYFADTICSLISYLKTIGFNPGAIEFYEVYKDRDVQIPPQLYSSDGDNWLFGNELCQSFRRIYPNHIGNEDCEFSDRSQAVSR